MLYESSFVCVSIYIHIYTCIENGNKKTKMLAFELVKKVERDPEQYYYQVLQVRRSDTFPFCMKK